MGNAVRIHPDNPKCFEFRGKPLALITATEHYGSVMNRPYDFERYLADANEKHQTLSRLFMLYRELQIAVNPYSTCKPESTDYISPFPRTGPGYALDGEPKYDLDQWNPEFFDRLHRFLSLASDYGIIIEVVMLSNSYYPPVWALNPLHADNNVNNLEQVEWWEVLTQRHPKLYDRQREHVRKIVEETNQYDNIIYEVCNEPFVSADAPETGPGLDELNDWHMALVGLIREMEVGLPNQHLIAGQESWLQSWQSADKAFSDLDLDIVNIHPSTNMGYGGKRRSMGPVSGKRLELRNVRDFCLASYHEPKPLNLDEDNAASLYKDEDGWTIHRKRAWTTVMCGAHYDMIDFSIINYSPIGTPHSQRCLRTWMKHLSEFAHSIDLGRARPLPEWLNKTPEHTVDSVMAVEEEDYCIYLAADHELDDPAYGAPIGGTIVMDLPDGDFEISCYSPVTGLYSPSLNIVGGSNTSFNLPCFEHDIIIRIRR